MSWSIAATFAPFVLLLAALFVLWLVGTPWATTHLTPTQIKTYTAIADLAVGQAEKQGAGLPGTQKFTLADDAFKDAVDTFALKHLPDPVRKTFIEASVHNLNDKIVSVAASAVPDAPAAPLSDDDKTALIDQIVTTALAAIEDHMPSLLKPDLVRAALAAVITAPAPSGVITTGGPATLTVPGTPTAQVNVPTVGTTAPSTEAANVTEIPSILPPPYNGTPTPTEAVQPPATPGV